jgi:tRNA A-37 threonylcarbamoyl transferase component Bud32
VEYEDHLLRLMRDAGLPTPRPYGFVEITPEREYLIVMEFFEGAHEMRGGPVDDQVIGDALHVVRRMWDVGVAHRDIKPSNVLVRDGKVLLIDVAFAAARPTPWRQAVDLANMMLTLALLSTPERVYERALEVFAAGDVAEAFAACRSITVPTQLRALVRADGRDLVGRFRQLAPSRPPVPVQLWTLRRIGVTAMLVASLAAGIAVFAGYMKVAGLL